MPAADILDIVVSAPPGGDVAIVVAVPDEPAVEVLLPAPAPVTVEVSNALPGTIGADGTSVTPVVLTLAAYLALTAPEQVDATKWYVIPKAT